MMCVALMSIDRSLTQLEVTKFPVGDLWVSLTNMVISQMSTTAKNPFQTPPHKVVLKGSSSYRIKPIVFLARAHSLVFVGMLAALADIA